MYNLKRCSKCCFMSPEHWTRINFRENIYILLVFNVFHVVYDDIYIYAILCKKILYHIPIYLQYIYNTYIEVYNI